MFGKRVNNIVCLISRCDGGITIVIIDVNQMTIVTFFEPVILVIRRSGGTIDNLTRFSKKLELFPIVSRAECLESGSHDHGVYDRIDTKIFRLVLVCFTSVVVYLSACNTRGVFTVDDLLDQFHLFISCSGNSVDFSTDPFKRFTSTHERR